MPIVAQAIEKMNQYIIDKKLRDGGTCVMGEGLEVQVLPPRCRNPVMVQVVRQPFQGNNYQALRYAQEYLKSQGIETKYNQGRMD